MHPHRPPSQFEAKEQYMDAHREIMAQLGRIQAAKGPGEIREAVSVLLTDLDGHVEQEERQDGLFDWVVALLPKARHRVDTLWSDHERLLRDLRALITLAGVESKADEFRKNLELFSNLLRDHERRENDLIREALATAEAETL